MQQRICLYVLSAAIGASTAPAQALDLALPGVNTGATSFEDGGGGVGHMFQTSNSRFDANRNYDAKGEKRPMRYDRALWIARLHYAYTSSRQAFGGHLGGELIVPLLDLELDLGPAHVSGSGLGNPSLGGYVQWRGKRLFGKRLDARLALAASLPLGDYDRNAKLNPGTDYYSINPYYAFTWHHSDAWEISGRLMYLWNGSSDDPETRLHAAFGQPVHRIQPGQALHYNLSASHALNARWRLGLAMYHLQQTSADRINGHAQAASKERLFGIGPGVQWRAGAHRFIGNVYAEGAAKNCAAGSQLVARYLYVWR